MICPNCGIAFHDSTNGFLEINSSVDLPEDESYEVYDTNCPSCSRFMIILVHLKRGDSRWEEIEKRVIYPRNPIKNSNRTNLPDIFWNDFSEASLVLQDSPKASAALSRRCLQNIIREKAGITKRTLAEEIEALLETNTLPSHIAEAVDAVRNIGNLAAHPTKNEHTGEIVPVEPGEAEWLLEVLEALFDFYFVQPAKLEERKNALNAKLEQLGKPPMKSPKNGE